MDDDRVKAARRVRLWCLTGAVAAFAGVVAISLWIRTAHTVDHAAAIAFTVLLLAGGVLLRIANCDRARDDPATAARLPDWRTSYFDRCIGARGTLSLILLAAFVLMIPLARLLGQPPIARVIHALFPSPTLTGVLIGMFAVSLALVLGVLAFYERFWARRD
jgi:hypothetical protein